MILYLAKDSDIGHEKAQERKDKIDKLYFLKIETFVLQRTPLRK